MAGRWLDYGCADGGYTGALLQAGAKAVVGVDVEADRIAQAASRQVGNASVVHLDNPTIPFPDASFDVAFVNEVQVGRRSSRQASVMARAAACSVRAALIGQLPPRATIVRDTLQSLAG